MQRFLRNLIISLNLQTIPIAILSTLLVALSLGAQPAYRAFKSWRSDRILATSKQLFEEESYLPAFQKAQAATLLDPDNLEASRQLATLAVQFHHPHAHQFWLSVLHHQEVQNSDWMHAVDAAFQSNELETAFDYLRDWELSGGGQDFDFLIRRAMAYARSDDYSTAVELLDQAHQQFPERPETSTLFRNLADTISSPNLTQHVSDLLLQQESPSLDELSWVAFNKTLSIEKRLQAIELSRQSGKLPLQHEILLLGLALKLGEEGAQSDFDALRNRIDPKDPNQLNAYTSILSDQGRHQEVLELLGQEPRTDDRILLRNQLLALLETGKLEPALEQAGDSGEDWPTTIAEESIIRALVFQKLGNQRQFQESVERAIQSTSETDFDFIEQRIADLGQPPLLVELYKSEAQKTQPGPELLFRWLQTAVSTGSLSEIQTAVDYAQAYPQARLSPQQRSLAAYYAILFGIGTEDAKNSAQNLAAQFPEETFFKYLLGFAYQRLGASSLANGAITGLTPTDGDRLSHFIHAYITGDISQVDGHQLLEAERNLLTIN